MSTKPAKSKGKGKMGIKATLKGALEVEQPKAKKKTRKKKAEATSES